MNKMRLFYLFTIIFFFMSCKMDNSGFQNYNNERIDLSGWWIYGEGYHSFMDEETLDEFGLQFLNEDSVEIIDLYLSVTEMEYFPMETKISGYKKSEIFMVDDFEITYIVGCDEQ